MTMAYQSNCNANQRLKRLLQRFAQAKLSKTFAAWKAIAKFEGSVQRLQVVLEPCRDALALTSCKRTPADVSAVLQLLQKVPLFAALAVEAQHCIAAHAELQVLSNGVEVPTCEEDSKQLYAVISGNVSLVHGDASNPRLQQLLQRANKPSQQKLSDISAAAAADASTEASPVCSADEAGTESVDLSATACAEGSRSSSLNVLDAPSCGTEDGARPAGVWQQVRQAASAGQKRAVHSSWHNHAGTGKATSTWPVQQLGHGGDIGAGIDVEGLVSCVSVQGVKAGATFCGYQFPTTAPVTFTAAAGYSSEDAPQLSQLPNSCLAAVADANSVAAPLVVSKAAYMEAMRLHHEHHVSRLLDMACRIPCLRHTPIKELHKLAAHMQETAYEPGQVLLQQGKEVLDVHFLVSGTVQLTYIPPAAAQQQRLGTACSGVTAASADATSRSAVSLQASVHVQAQQVPTVLGTRGPGWVLGDDAMRERRIAVSVTAATRVTTLKVAPQKLLCALDPLTLRLFGRLRQQQPAAQQQLIQAALTDTSPHTQQPPPQHQLRTVVLDQVYETIPKPTTILRPGDAGYQQLQDQETDSHKPPWHSVRSKGPTTVICGKDTDSLASTLQRSPTTGKACLGRGPAATAAAASSHAVGYSAHDTVGDDLESWAARLPKGLTLDKCAGLSQSVSVMQLIGLIRDVEGSRRLQSESPPPAACGQRPTAKSTTYGLPGAAAAGSAVGDSVHTELLESCGVAVLQIRVLPGQAPVSGPALAGALDDVAAAWAAVTYDEGLQLVRWSATRWIMIGQLEPGTSKRAGLEGLAGAVLSAAVRLSGVINRTPDILPVVGLAAGVASGSCFVQYEAGNFVNNVSGRAYDAAAELCAQAAATSASALSHSHASKDSSHSTILVTDGVAAMLQTSFWLEPCGGSSLLISAHPVLSPPPGSRMGTSTNPSQSSGRQTLGPGRNTMVGLGANLLNPTTPKTPGGGLLLPNWGRAQNERRQMRRKFEALQDLLAGAGDTLPPPPEYMLTQPPPVGGPGRFGVISVSGTTSYARSAGVTGAAGSHGVTFSPAVEAGGASCDSSTSGSGSKKGLKPRLTISVDGDAASAAAEVAAGSNSASTPGAKGSCRSPGSKTPKRASLRGGVGTEGPSDSLLTPTLIMQSPWSEQQQHMAAAGLAAIGRAATAALPAAQAKAGGSRCSTPSSMGSRRQSTVGQALGARQSVRQQVWQEVQEMRETDVPAPVGLKHQEATSGGFFQRTGTPPTADHLFSSIGSGSRSVFSSGHGARFTVPSMPGVSGLSNNSCLQAKCTRPRSADAAIGGSVDVSAAGGRLKVTFQTPRTSRKCTGTNGVWGSSNGSKPSFGSSDGRLQQHGLSRKSLGSHAVQQQLQQGLTCSNDGTIGSRNGSSNGQVTRRQAGTAAGLLASKAQLLRSSLGGNGSEPGSCCPHLHHSQQQQQQQQLEPAHSEAESLNSMSLYPEEPDISSSCWGIATASVAAQLEQQRHQAIVMSACKALGSYAAAKAYVAALPNGLMTVNLSTAGLNHLPPLTRLTQLEQLSASFNKLDSLPSLIPADAAAVAAAAAAAADISSSSSSSSNSSSAVLKTLTQQLLSGAASSLPATLTRLGLAYNKLEQLALELPAALPHLTELDLSHNQLTELPTTFGALSCLKQLYMNNNQLAALPGSFTRLYSVQTLNLSHNCLTQLPSDLQHLPSLVSLQVQHNQLQGLPQGFTDLSGLKSLGLGYNNLMVLPTGLLMNLSGLTSLDLAGNRLSDQQLEVAAAAAAAREQPAAVEQQQSAAGCCTAVIQQKLQEGTTTCEPPSPRGQAAAAGRAASAQQVPCLPLLEVSPALQVLDLSYNQLQRLPDWLSSSLKQLSVNNNHIAELSGSICSKLSGLTVLELHNNRLAAVPRELMHMEHIQVLALADNPGLDCEVVAAEETETGKGAERSERIKEGAAKSERIGTGRSEKSVSKSAEGVVWVCRWMMQRKSAAAAAILRGVSQQRQQKQQQVTGSLLKGLLPGIRQTVIVESGRML